MGWLIEQIKENVRQFRIALLGECRVEGYHIMVRCGEMASGDVVEFWMYSCSRKCGHGEIKDPDGPERYVQDWKEAEILKREASKSGQQIGA